jgi:hypothetical protein
MTGAAWFGAALASVVAFLIGRFKGNQAARLACIDRAAAEERAEIWHAQARRSERRGFAATRPRPSATSCAPSCHGLNPASPMTAGRAAYGRSRVGA